MKRVLLIPAVAIVALAPSNFAAAQLVPMFDHLKCYQIKDYRAFSSSSWTADLDPEQAPPFAAELGCTIKSKAKYFCIDVEKTNVSPPPPLDVSGDPAQDYLCYGLVCPPVVPMSLQVADQFAEGEILVKKPKFLCAPACKTCPASLCSDSAVTTQFGGGPIATRSVDCTAGVIELPNAGPTLGAAGSAPRWNVDFQADKIRVDFIDMPANYGIGAAFTFGNLDSQYCGEPGPLTGVTVTTNSSGANAGYVSTFTTTSNSVTVPISPTSGSPSLWKPGDYFEVHLGGRCAPPPTPTPTSTPTPTTTATPRPYKIVFATSSMTQGNFGGALAADSRCQQAATAAGLPGTFFSWVSDTTTSPSARFTQSALPYVRTDGATVANNWAGLTSGTLLNPIELDEFGNLVSQSCGSCLRGVWTGTLPNGTPAGGSTCSNWTTTISSDNAVMGDATATTSDWTQVGVNIICSVQAHIYCFEQ